MAIVETVVETRQGKVEGEQKRRTARLSRYSVRAAAGRFAAVARARTGRALERRARSESVRRAKLATAASGWYAAGRIDVGVGAVRRGLPHAERVDPGRRRSRAAGDGVDSRRRVLDRQQRAGHLRRQRAVAPRRRGGRDHQLSAWRARLPASHRRHRTGASRRPATKVCSIRSRRSNGCETTSRGSAAIPPT